MKGRCDVALERLIQGLERELLDAADEEFMAGARDLGMDPAMKGSAAFLGVKDHTVQMLDALRRAYYAPPSGDRGPAQDDPEERDAQPSGPKPPKRNADA